MFEQAKWIAKDNAEQILPAPLFRKVFTVEKPVASARLHVCGLGLGEYYLNGKKIADDVLCTPFTKYDSTVIFNSYDVSSLLRTGSNALGAILGNGCYIFTFPRFDYFKPVWLHHTKLIAQLDITYADGTTAQICSDRSWKSADSPIVYNETKRGEIYDARLEIPGWDTPEFDDSDWQPVFICRSPGGVIRSTDCPPIRVCGEYPAKKISETVYDIGQNISGWVKIKVRGQRDQKIVIRYAEILKDDGTPDFEKLNTIPGAITHTDTYICKGDGIEEWAPRFAYHGFRYFDVTGAPEEFEALGQFVHTDLSVWGEFTCSDPLLNQIHHMCRMSTLSNAMGLVTDCPTREQNGWTGDALLSVDQSIMNYDMESLYSKWFQDIRDEQRPSGQIPGIAPTGGFGYNWGSGPVYDGVLIMTPWLLFQYTGSTRLLKENWESMKKYMEFIATMAEEGMTDFGLGDWCPPPDVTITPSVLTDTAFYYLEAATMAKCAVLLGEDPSVYHETSQLVRKAFRDRFVTDGLVNFHTQTAVSCAIYCGLLEEHELADNAALLNKLVVDHHYRITCGIYGSKFIFSALSEFGYDETLYKMVTNPAMPSYAYWVSQGMTTLGENWNMKDSLNHHMFSEVDMWFYRYLAGIQLSETGLTIHPHFLQNLDSLRAIHRNVEVSWNKTSLTVISGQSFTLVMDGNAAQYPPGNYCFPRT